MDKQISRIRSISLTLAVLLLSFVLIHGSLVAASDPEKTFLFNKLTKAQTEQEGQLAEEAIWRYWMNQSPTPEVRTALDAGMERREAYDYEAAEKHFGEVIALAPDYAEGYNQRAFIRFLRENYGGAESDLEKALELEPEHFGAMAGLYQVLLRQDRQQVALKMLQQAVGIHPWLQERFGLPETMWPKKYRDLHDPAQEI